MGDPRKHRSKYSGPSHPWNKERIDAETILIREYGLKNKKEIWKAQSSIRNFASYAKKLIRLKQSAQSEKEKEQFLSKLVKLNLISDGSTLDSVLGLKIKDLLERRLQTILFRKGLARSVKQARQFIVHKHILVNGKKITVPSYYVLLNEENAITFSENSNLNDLEHPERKMTEKPEETEVLEAKHKKETVKGNDEEILENVNLEIEEPKEELSEGDE